MSAKTWLAKNPPKLLEQVKLAPDGAYASHLMSLVNHVGRRHPKFNVEISNMPDVTFVDDKKTPPATLITLAKEQLLHYYLRVWDADDVDLDAIANHPALSAERRQQMHDGIQDILMNGSQTVEFVSRVHVNPSGEQVLDAKKAASHPWVGCLDGAQRVAISKGNIKVYDLCEKPSAVKSDIGYVNFHWRKIRPVLFAHFYKWKYKPAPEMEYATRLAFDPSQDPDDPKTHLGIIIQQGSKLLLMGFEDALNISDTITGVLHGGMHQAWLALNQPYDENGDLDPYPKKS